MGKIGRDVQCQSLSRGKCMLSAHAIIESYELLARIYLSTSTHFTCVNTVRHTLSYPHVYHLLATFSFSHVYTLLVYTSHNQDRLEANIGITIRHVVTYSIHHPIVAYINNLGGGEDQRRKKESSINY